MTTTLAAFLTREVGFEDQFEAYRIYARLARDAFLHTNPGGSYVILTDKPSAVLLHEFSVIVATPDDLPLMLKSLYAARSFLDGYAKQGELSLIADADCVVQKDISWLMAGFDDPATLVTYNDKSLRVNNIAYTRDPDTLSRVMKKALDILAGWPMHLKKWWGDQEAWDIALGDRVGEPGRQDYRSVLYPSIGFVPCSLYNCFMPKNGNTKSGTANAFLVHFKGDRKQHMDQYVDRIIQGATK